MMDATIGLIVLCTIFGLIISSLVWDYFEPENPLYKPLFFMGWPILTVVVIIDITIVNWIRDVIDYYKKKREVDLDNDI